jgi:hypothetical protein
VEALSEIREQVVARLEELRPLIREGEQLESVLAAIDALPEEQPAVPSSEVAPMRLPVAVRKKQVLALLVERGVVRIGDVGKALGVSHARAVQLANALEGEGLLQRTDGGVEVTSEGARQTFGIKFTARGVQEVRP